MKLEIRNANNGYIISFTSSSGVYDGDSPEYVYSTWEEVVIALKYWFLIKEKEAI